MALFAPAHFVRKGRSGYIMRSIPFVFVDFLDLSFPPRSEHGLSGYAKLRMRNGVTFRKMRDFVKTMLEFEVVSSNGFTFSTSASTYTVGVDENFKITSITRPPRGIGGIFSRNGDTTEHFGVTGLGSRLLNNAEF